MSLTDIAIRALKPRATRFKVSDGDGLQIWVLPSGTKVWHFAYRLNKTQKDLVLGKYPVIGLAEARKRRDDARTLMAAGADPSHQRKLDKLTKAITDAATFNAIADEYLAKLEREGRAPSTMKKLRWQLRYMRPHIGDRPISEIKAPEVLAALKKIEAKGAYETAIRVKETTGAIFRLAMATGQADTDPTQALKRALTTPRVKHRPALTNAIEFGGLLRAIDDFNGQPTTKAALQLLAIVFTRPGELRNAEWAEFDFSTATWTIPAGRMKMRRKHHVPLPRQALAILKALQEITGDGTLLFPGTRSNRRPISENTLNAALRRMGYSKDEVTAHGFRATASTLLNESCRFSSDAIERALAHQDPDDIRRAYQRGTFWEERIEMSQWWADHLDRLRVGGEVVSIRATHATPAK